MITTKRYGLKKPAENDYYSVDDANQNTDRIEEELGKAEDHRSAANPHSGSEALLKNAATKTTLVDADSMAVVDSADGSKTKRVSWGAVKTVLKSYFNSIYVPMTRKINNKTLNADISLVSADVGAVSAKKVTSAAGVEIGVVTSVCGKTGAVMLSAAEVGARPVTWMPGLGEVGGSNRNLLDNSYWALRGLIVNQRGQESYTVSRQYTIDRWLLYGAGSLGIESAGIALTSSAEGGNLYLKQPLEHGAALAGMTVTFSCLVTSGYGTLMLVQSNTSYGIEPGETIAAKNIVGAGLHQLTATIPAALNKSLLKLVFHTTSSLKVSASKFEIGTEQTLARQDTNGNWVLIDPPPDYGMELAKCQRYYRELVGYWDVNQYANDLIVFYINTDDFNMRVNPAVTIKDSSKNNTIEGMSVRNRQGVVIAGFTFTLGFNGDNKGAKVSAAKAGHGLNTTDCFLGVPKYTPICLNADL